MKQQIEYNLQGNNVTLTAKFVSLIRATGEGGALAKARVDVSALAGLCVEMTKAGETSRYAIPVGGTAEGVTIAASGSELTITATKLPKGHNVLVLKAKYGTETRTLCTVHLNVSASIVTQEAKEIEVTVVDTIGDGAGEMKEAIQVTYDELRDLISDAELVAGQYYRITDYNTVVNANIEYATSAGHLFDVIVLALTSSTLSEEAHACRHEGDTYFNTCNIEAWKLWYDYRNDTDRYEWADEDNGKGVIYRMIDEWNNDCPYDFKNILFKRWAVTDVTRNGSSVGNANTYIYEEGSQDIRYGLKGNDYNQGSLRFEVDGEDYGFYYTFSWVNEDGVVEDASIVGQLIASDEGFVYGVHDNTLRLCLSRDSEIAQNKMLRALNNNVFVSTYSYDGVFYGCSSNMFGNECSSNTFGNDCSFNTFGNECSFNTFGNDCPFNTFGNSCSSNTFGNSCHSNTFGNSCHSNTFGNSCPSNTFGNSCPSNTFGNNCNSNTFGNSCSSNTFGNDCPFNTFGNSCSFNTFGNSCSSNTFGNECSFNTFGTNAGDNTILTNFMRYATLEDGVRYVDITCSVQTSASAYGQNIRVHSGVVGTSNARKTCSISSTNNAFLTEFGVVQQGTVA